MFINSSGHDHVGPSLIQSGSYSTFILASSLLFVFLVLLVITVSRLAGDDFVKLLPCTQQNDTVAVG